MLPAATVDDTVATLRQLAVVAKISEGNLIVLDKSAGLIRNIGATAPVLLMLDHSLLQLAFQVLSVRSCLLQLLEYFALIG